MGIQTIGDRILVSDVQESVHFVKYRRGENQLVVFADDTSPRWVTSACILDYQTVAVADKFGNVSVLRLPNNVNDNVDEDPTGTKALWDRGLLNGASQKAELICVIHVGEIALSLQVKNFFKHFVFQNLFVHCFNVCNRDGIFHLYESTSKIFYVFW